MAHRLLLAACLLMALALASFTPAEGRRLAGSRFADADDPQGVAKQVAGQSESIKASGGRRRLASAAAARFADDAAPGVADLKAEVAGEMDEMKAANGRRLL